MAKLDFTTKPLSLSQRIEMNNIMEVKTDGSSKMVTIKNTFGFQIYGVQAGLKTLNGVEVTDKNREQLINGLDNDEIAKISDQVAEETNFSKKKKS